MVLLRRRAGNHATCVGRDRWGDRPWNHIPPFTVGRGGTAQYARAGAVTHARDSALGFYERLGWKAVGDGYVYGPMKLPHHLALWDL